MKKLIIASALVAGVTSIAMGPASAATPVAQGCVGESVSARAQASDNYGRDVIALYTEGGIGSEVQLLQAGGVPDGIYPNTCND